MEFDVTGIPSALDRKIINAKVLLRTRDDN